MAIPILVIVVDTSNLVVNIPRPETGVKIYINKELALILLLKQTPHIIYKHC